MVRTAIERIVPEGVVTVDGKLHEVDIICFATGFLHSDFLASMEITGRGGVSLREQWGDAATAYLGITIPNFPNLFCMYGPGTNLAAGASLFYHSEFQSHYALDAIHRVLAADARSIEVRPDAHDEYADRYQKEISSLVWAHPRSPTAITRTRRARCTRSRRGRSTSTGPGPAPSTPRTTSSLERGAHVRGATGRARERAEQGQLLGAAAGGLSVEDHQDLTF